jgi:hypothetical protein
MHVALQLRGRNTHALAQVVSASDRVRARLALLTSLVAVT